MAAGRQDGYERSHWHHVHCGGTTGVSDMPGGLTGPPLPQFPRPSLALQPLPAAPHTGPAAARLLPAAPRDWGYRDPGPKTGGAGERTAAPPHGAQGPGRPREPLGPRLAEPRRVRPCSAKRSRAFPSNAESCRPKSSLADRSRVLPSETEPYTNSTESGRAL